MFLPLDSRKKCLLDKGILDISFFMNNLITIYLWTRQNIRVVSESIFGVPIFYEQ